MESLLLRILRFVFRTVLRIVLTRMFRRARCIFQVVYLKKKDITKSIVSEYAQLFSVMLFGIALDPVCDLKIVFRTIRPFESIFESLLNSKNSLNSLDSLPRSEQ